MSTQREREREREREKERERQTNGNAWVSTRISMVSPLVRLLQLSTSSLVVVYTYQEFEHMAASKNEGAPTRSHGRNPSDTT